MMIRVLVADDHIIIRGILRRLLERAGDIEIVAMASDGQEAVDQAGLLFPDVAVMDVSMPLMNGIEATKKICADGPKTRVLMVSAYLTPHYIQRCLLAGAFGYVLKDTVAADLVIAVRSLFGGTRYFSKQIAQIAEDYIQ